MRLFAPFRLRLVAVFLLPLLIAACSGSDGNDSATSVTAASDAAATVTSTPSSQGGLTPAPTAAATTPVTLTPDGNRIKTMIEHLSTTIGPRPAGTAPEEEGANYLAGLLRGYGYEVEVKPFTMSREVSREAKITVTTPDNRTVPSNPLSSSGASTAKGQLVGAGIGRPEEIPANARGAILLVERGDLTFQQKVMNAQAAGAAGIIIFNNAPGNFFGTLSAQSSIPAVSVSEAEGKTLRDQLSRNPQVEITVGEVPLTDSHNVIAKPPGKECQTITGGHMDSVAAASGANDNASGSATVVEIAGVIASQGKMGNNCFVLFGGEELGLLGSEAFVQSLTPSERSNLRAMLNFDMVGFGSEPWHLIGSSAMQTKATEIAKQLGIATQIRGEVAGAGSDHASFIQAGIPSVFFYRANDPQWHQPGDTADRLSPALLEEAARMGVAMLEALSLG